MSIGYDALLVLSLPPPPKAPYMIDYLLVIPGMDRWLWNLVCLVHSSTDFFFANTTTSSLSPVAPGFGLALEQTRRRAALLCVLLAIVGRPMQLVVTQVGVGQECDLDVFYLYMRSRIDTIDAIHNDIAL